MKCPGCGAEVVDGSKACPKCGRELGMGARAVGETEHLAKETGAVVGKIGRGALGGVKGFVAGARKGAKGEDSEKKE